MLVKRIFLIGLLSLPLSFISCSNNENSNDNNVKTTIINEDKVPWKVGVLAYTFRNFTFFEAVDKAKELGLAAIGGYPGQEIGGGIEGKMGFDMNAEKREKVLAYLQKQGVKMVDFGVVTPSSNEDWRKLFEFADAMGIPVIVSEPKPEQLEKVVALGDEFDIDIAIHNHPSPSIYADPEVMLATIQQYSNRLGVCADVGHWIRSGFDPVQSLKKLEGRLMELHFKDESVLGKEAEEIVWGTGVANVKGMLEELKHQNFSGVLAIEYESRPEDNMDEIKQSLQYYHDVIGNW
jgi:sugar phosphate isomerase/epimerase